MLLAGLTGGIASGKSTVAGWFAELGAVVLDADLMAHEAVARKTPGWKAVVDTFGEQILAGDGQIDRKTLGSLVFNDPEKRALLEKIIHPLVRSRINAAVEEIRRRNPGAVVVQDIPLLFESGMDHGFDEIIVVYIPEHLQLKRLMARDRLNAEQATARIRSQMPLEEKKQLATIVIDNSGNLEDTRRQTEYVYGQLLQKAGNTKNGN